MIAENETQVETTPFERRLAHLYFDFGWTMARIRLEYRLDRVPLRNILAKFGRIRSSNDRQRFTLPKPKVETFGDMRLNKILARIKITDGCWEWQGARYPSGYGHVSWQGNHVYTHRLIYELCHGDIPKGMHVCHTCDNPPCCNPEHLWLGTPKQNTQDSIKKGRWNAKRGIVAREKALARMSDEERKERRRAQKRAYARTHYDKHIRKPKQAA